MAIWETIVKALDLFGGRSMKKWDYVWAMACLVAMRKLGVRALPAKSPLRWLVPFAAASATFAVFRSLPDISDVALDNAEARLMSTIRSKHDRRWTTFRTARCTWTVHSLHVKAVANASPGRPDIVLVHGHSAGIALWESVFDSLASFGNLHVIDLPGWGRSPTPDELASADASEEIIELYTECLRGWTESVGLERFTLIGHSFGGTLSTRYAVSHPETIEQLILVAPGGVLPIIAANSYLWAHIYRHMSPQRVARWLGRPMYVFFRYMYQTYSGEDKRFPDYYYQMAAATGRRGRGKGDKLFNKFVRWSTSQLRVWWDQPLIGHLLQLDIPTAIVWGRNDPLVASRTGLLLNRVRPNTDLYFVDNASHNPAHSRVDAFCEAVLQAVQRHMRRSTGKQSPSKQPSPAAQAGRDAAASDSSGDDDDSTLQNTVRMVLRRRAASFDTTRSGRQESPHAARRSDETNAAQTSAQYWAEARLNHCHGCHTPVSQYKHFWWCACGAWSFRAKPSAKGTMATIDQMEAFLETLYVDGTFDATTSPHIRLLRLSDHVPEEAIQQLQAADVFGDTASSSTEGARTETAERRRGYSGATRGEVYLV